MGKCVFSLAWTKHDSYKHWVLPVSSDRHKAFCRVCKKNIDIAKMGESALKSHNKSIKHKENIGISEKTFTISGFLKSKSNDTDTSKKKDPTIPPPPPPPPPPEQSKACDSQQSATNVPAQAATGSSTLTTYVSKNDVLRAEILYALKVITNHHSYHSCTDSNKIFQIMFPDSTIAKKFSCGEKKVAYMCVFGLGDYFRNELRKSITGPFVILFDESLNKKSQKKQMDIHVRYMVGGVQVTTRFLDSVFLGMCGVA